MSKYIKEDLNVVKKEVPSNVSLEAARMGLSYVGFGRYQDPKSQQVTHIGIEDKLIPLKKAIKSNSFKQNNMDDIGQYGSLMEPEIQELHEQLIRAYSPNLFDTLSRPSDVEPPAFLCAILRIFPDPNDPN